METKFDENKFWNIYDQNIRNTTPNLRAQLRAMIKTHEKIGDLKRLEKGWIRPVAWECLEDTTIFTEDNRIIEFPLGEIIIEQLSWDRDVYITNLPRKEHVSGGILHNSSCFDGKLLGLWLPLYETETIKKKINQQFETAKEKAISFVNEEMIYWPKSQI